MTRDRLMEFLLALAQRLDAMYGVLPGAGPTMREVLEDDRDYPTAAADAEVQFAMGFLRGAAEAQDMTLYEMLWEADINDEPALDAYPRAKPFTN